jgi:hypothetical protein
LIADTTPMTTSSAIPIIAMPPGGLPDPAVPLTDQPAQLTVGTRAADWAWSCAERDLAARYPKLGEGAFRTVYDGGDVVYKLGMPDAHDRELAAYEDPSTYAHLPVAPCRVVHHVSGLPILIMECVRPLQPHERPPSWADQVDGRQVGQLASGQWAVFDANLACTPALTLHELERGAQLPFRLQKKHAIPARFAAYTVGAAS